MLQKSVAVSTLAMLVDVEALLLYSLVHTHADSLVHYLEDDVGHHDAVEDAHHGGYHLNPKLVPVALECALNAVGTRDVTSGEHTGEDRSQNTAHAVYSEGVERIVVSELLLHYCHHEEADDGGDNSDAESS